MKQTKFPLRLLCGLLALWMLATLLVGCGQSAEGDILIDWQQLNRDKYTVTVSTGSAGASILPTVLPDATVTYNNSDAEAYLMVQNGKADAYVYDKAIMQYAMANGGLEGLSILPGVIDSVDVAVGVNPNREDLLPELNAFIAELRADGTLDDMYDRWVVRAEETMPAIAVPENPARTLKVGTAGILSPMTYLGENNEVMGLDIELLRRYALYANVAVEIEVMSFDALLASLQSDRLDLVFSNLNATPERREVIRFSDAYLYSETVALVRSDRLPDASTPTRLEHLNGKTVGYLMGASYTDAVEAALPDSQIVGYNSFSEMIQALKSGRIAGYIADEPIAQTHLRETDGLRLLPDEPLTDDRFGFLFAKDDTELQTAFNGILQKLKAEGALDALKEKWILGEGDPDLRFDESIPTPNGILEVGTVLDAMPFAYAVGSNTVGYDVELLYMICEELGYEPRITTYPFTALLPAVSSGKAEVGIGCITYTEERAETLLFTDATYEGGPIAVVRGETEADGGFFSDLADSFERTLIREDRWKLIVSGLGVTIALSLLSILCGTLLGFAFSFPLRSKNRLVSGLSRLVSTVIDGLPLLVILMVLYYIIFAKSSLPALLIGVIGFTLDFANAVAGMLNTGVKAVDVGQIEAAESMGYGRFMIFCKITFPQAANQMFGQYAGGIISLIKGTSIIGYITVEDLTKASDIIRSRTYEAFFPLFVTAVIYFIIARIFVAVLAAFAKRLDPKRRKREVKGVRYDDPH